MPCRDNGTRAGIVSQTSALLKQQYSLTYTKAQGQYFRQAGVDNFLLGPLNIIRHTHEPEGARFGVEQAVAGRRITVTWLTNAADIDYIAGFFLKCYHV